MISFPWMFSMIVALFALAMPRVIESQTENVLYSFTGQSDGGLPYSTLVADEQGNLYGTAQSYGDNGCFPGCGTLFELERDGAGRWNFQVLYSFTGGSDGNFPCSPLIFDSDGNVYGTTAYGGNNENSGNGTVFELERSVDGWVEKVLYAFTGGSDGGFPIAGLAMDGMGTHDRQHK